MSDEKPLRTLHREADARLDRLHRAIALLSVSDCHLVRTRMLGTLVVHVEDELWDLALKSATDDGRALR